MFSIAGWGTILLALALAVALTWAVLRWGSGRGLAVRIGCMTGIVVWYLVVLMLFVNRKTLTVTSFSDLGAFLYLIGLK